MDNLGSNGNLNNNLDKPIPFDDGDKPIPLGNPPAGGAPSVSRAPLTLGGGDKTPAAPAQRPAAPAPARQVAAPAPVKRAPVEAPIAAGQRITGVKTFFTKLHPGAIGFLDEQIGGWLKDHPEVSVKHTNIVTGEVQAKKTEPNIIVTLWY